MATNYEEFIEKSTETLKKFRKSTDLYNREKDILELMKQRYELYRAEIHDVLAQDKNDNNENLIRHHIKTIFILDLPICESKIKKFQMSLDVYQKRKDEKNVQLCYQYLQEWLDLYENNFALTAFRSLEQFALFMEWEKEDKDKVWKYSLDPYNDNGYTGANKPFFYYFNQMVLKKDIKVITKQLPTGYGKSYGNAFAVAWLFGVDVENDVLLVLGNPSLILNNVNTIVDIIKNPRFVKVFPQFEKYLDIQTDKAGKQIQIVKDDIFSTCRAREGVLTFNDSTKPINLRVISKDTSIDGIRIRYLFLDDICRSKDAGNMKQHEKDISDYWNSWWKRNYNTNDFYIIISGTAYSLFDIISQLIAYYSKGKMERTQQFKYAFTSIDKSCVFIKIPKIDDDLNRSTYPQKFPYEEAIKIKERNLRDFMAMEQQQPIPPENSPFYIDNLQTYEAIPEEGRSDYCWASLDSARVGFDYNSMPIFVKVGEKFYLKDCLYLNEPMEKVYQTIIDKIKQHKITKFVIEKNIDTSLKALLGKMLAEQGVGYCEIIEVYSTVKKEEKIYNMENTIKNYIVFPAMGLYTYSSQMGKFMNDIFSFSYTHKVEHDDSIDSIATFCDKLIVAPKANTKAQVLYV